MCKYKVKTLHGLLNYSRRDQRRGMRRRAEEKQTDHPAREPQENVDRNLFVW